MVFFQENIKSLYITGFLLSLRKKFTIYFSDIKINNNSDYLYQGFLPGLHNKNKIYY